MKLNEVLSVPGVAGLFKLLSTTKNNIIIESMADGKRQSLAINHKVSLLGDISVYTKDEEIPLGEVFKKIQEADGEKLSVSPHADPDTMRKYFKKIIPGIDEERVHPSHMKKILAWYEILKGKIDFTKADEDVDGQSVLPESGDAHHGTQKVHETHAPKADKHAKVTTVKLRKKV